ncbi:hypothetical protein [Phytohalomonas tamaricis]|uniref:hypothetical protein n=1 Tax=Phytohalomonas tamaricis TaxID=2081032 RepID=UPI00131A3EE2|nr:hypothetical protein [Phytohalomonas tamaricis]
MLNKQQVQLARQVSSSNQIAIYGLSYALSAEQAKAGEFEADKNGRQEALDKARGYVGGLRYKIGKLEQKLAQCRSTTNMVSGDGWTGQAEIKPKKEDE